MKKISIDGIYKDLDGNYNLCQCLHLESTHKFFMTQRFWCSLLRMKDKFEYQNMLIEITFGLPTWKYRYTYKVQGELQAGGRVSNIQCSIIKL